MADPADEAYRPDWASLFDAVAVDRDGGVDVDLLFGAPPSASVAANGAASVHRIAEPAARGAGDQRPYVPAGEADGETAYLLNSHYFALTASQPRKSSNGGLPTGRRPPRRCGAAKFKSGTA